MNIDAFGRKNPITLPYRSMSFDANNYKQYLFKFSGATIEGNYCGELVSWLEYRNQTLLKVVKPSNDAWAFGWNDDSDPYYIAPISTVLAVYTAGPDMDRAMSKMIVCFFYFVHCTDYYCFCSLFFFFFLTGMNVQAHENAVARRVDRAKRKAGKIFFICVIHVCVVSVIVLLYANFFF